MKKVLKIGFAVIAVAATVAGFIVMGTVNIMYGSTYKYGLALLILGAIGFVAILVADNIDDGSSDYIIIDLNEALKVMRTHTKGNYMVQRNNIYVGIIVKEGGNRIKHFSREKDCLRWFRREGK